VCAHLGYPLKPDPKFSPIKILSGEDLSPQRGVALGILSIMGGTL